MRFYPTLLACAALLLGACAALPPEHMPRDCNICPETVVIPAGHYLMGTPADYDESWSLAREGPQHAVTIVRPFAIGRFEVTRAENGETGDGCHDWNGQTWVSTPGRNWRHPGFPQTDRDPVVCVSWDDANAYARWLSAKTGMAWRLPSEAVWEYAARAGTTTRRYWGDGLDAACAYANFSDLTLRLAFNPAPVDRCADGYVHTAPVGSLKPNAWGLHDMLGNAWEWTTDCWHEGYIGAPTDGSARAEPECERRVNRGAGWNSNPRHLRVSNRGNYAGIYRYNIIGFRLVRSD